MSRSLIEQSANEGSEAVVFICRAMVKLVDAKENVVEFSGVYAVKRIKKRGMCAYEFSSSRVVEKLSDNGLLRVLASGS